MFLYSDVEKRIMSSHNTHSEFFPPVFKKKMSIIYYPNFGAITQTLDTNKQKPNVIFHTKSNNLCEEVCFSLSPFHSFYEKYTLKQFVYFSMHCTFRIPSLSDFPIVFMYLICYNFRGGFHRKLLYKCFLCCVV